MLKRRAFLEEYPDFQRELSEYYATYPIPVPHVEARIDMLDQENPKATSYERKAFIYRAAAETCEVHLFRHCSFFYEIQAGRARNGVTAGFPPEPGIGGWLMRKNAHKEKQFFDWSTPYNDDLMFVGIFFADFSHYPVNVDNLFQYGFRGMIERARTRLANCEMQREAGFEHAVISGLESLIAIAHKFAQKAEAMLEIEQDPTVINRLKRIAHAAQRIPENPPETFYEALALNWFVKELTITMEGIGQAVVCHIDRQMYPYYQRDLEAGRISRDEAKDLVAEFLAITDSKWDINEDTAMGGVNTTVFVGGCDEHGEPVFNDITRMVFEIYHEYHLVNPKLQVRISKDSPEEFLDIVAETAAKGLNVMSIFNDDVMIKAQVSMGKPLKDSRLYVGGGCQEPVLPNSECNIRAFCYINMPKILNDTITPKDSVFWAMEQVDVQNGESCENYEQFYGCVLHNMRASCEKLVENYNRLQSDWVEYSPCPLYSASLDGCIENAKDMTEGGARLNYSSLSPVGLGTFIDSLYAIKKVVFEDSLVSLPELAEMLRDNFNGKEDFRQYLLNFVDKYGEDEHSLNEFAAQIVQDIADVSSGMQDCRGGTYEPSLFSNLSYLSLKEYDATPDGRRKGEILSRGISPSDQGGASVVSKIIHSLHKLDLARYPAGAVLYLDMPYTPDREDNDIYKAILKYFVAEGGNILDINTMNPDDLRAAQAHPDQHRNLVVRVWGFSAYFVTLTQEMQDEMINRIIKT